MIKIIVSFMILGFFPSSVFSAISWCGNTTMPSNVQIKQSVSIYSEVYPDYYGIHAQVEYTTNNWTSTQYQLMSYDSHVGNNGKWKGIIGPFQGGVIVQYYIHFWDEWGSTCFDNNGGANFQFKINWTSNTGWPNVGFPSGNGFWYEEGLIGNNYTTIQIDRSGSVHDIYYPTVGVRSKMATAAQNYPDSTLNVKHIVGGIKTGAKTYWISYTENFSTYTQGYVPDTNVIITTAVLNSSLGPFEIYMYDFSPKGSKIIFPAVKNSTDLVQGIYLKRFLIKNVSTLTQSVTFFYNENLDLNGGKMYDYALWNDDQKYIMHWDSKWRKGETGIHPWPGFVKDCSIAFGIALKQANVPVSQARPDGFGIDGDYQLVPDVQGWMGKVIKIPPKSIKEIDTMLVAAFAPSTMSHQSLLDNNISPAVSWFYNQDIAYLQNQTENYWKSWLSSSTIVETPSLKYNTLYKRSLLATALHYDETYGGIVAGYTNGNYAYVWPRDLIFAAMTLDRAGHPEMVEKTYNWLNHIADRSAGWLFQKYMTDGVKIWRQPQVDNTSLIPYGAWHHYLLTGSTTWLTNNWSFIKDASYISSQNSGNSEMYYDSNTDQMFSWNLWEDQLGEFLYSNATVEAGLNAGAKIGYLLGNYSDADTFVSRSTKIHNGTLNRVDKFLTSYNNPPTVDLQPDCSMLYLSLLDPFNVLAATESRMIETESKVYDYCNMPPGSGNPDTNGLMRRYNGPFLFDTYFGGNPWVACTLFHSQYWAKKSDLVKNSGTAEMDIMNYKLNRVADFLSPLGLSSEQIVVSATPESNNFYLKAAWPNTWESMSSIADTIIKFIDPLYISKDNQLIVKPKLPQVWTVVSSTLAIEGGKFWVKLDHGSLSTNQIKSWMKNSSTGRTINYNIYMKIPDGRSISSVQINGIITNNWSYDTATQRIKVWNQIFNGLTDMIVVTLV